MRLVHLPIALAVLLFSGGACHSPSGLVCTAEYVHGLAIRVTDAETGDPITPEVSVVVTDGDYTSPVTPVGDGMGGTTNLYHAAGERSGRYTVEVKKSGYADWVRTNVRVTHDGCHVKTVHLDAKLAPLS